VRDRPGSTSRARVHSLDGEHEVIRRDDLAVEEPLEIRVATASLPDRPARTVAITMRTPGSDFELAAGFLYAEGVVRGPDDIARIAYCPDPQLDSEQRFNVVTVTLALDAGEPDLPGLERHVFTSSACGVCGAASLEVLHRRGAVTPPPGPVVDVNVLYGLPDTLRAAQGVFAATGGLHAAGLFTVDGDLVVAREDVGRHNAVDKLIGWAMLSGRLPAHELVLMVSGRVGYEIVQKAVTAGVPFVCAVSAPSSLAVAVAEEFDLTLVGFLRGRSCNVYSGRSRVGVPVVVR
jgi:FdhD protein